MSEYPEKITILKESELAAIVKNAINQAITKAKLTPGQILTKKEVAKRIGMSQNTASEEMNDMNPFYLRKRKCVMEKDYLKYIDRLGN